MKKEPPRCVLKWQEGFEGITGDRLVRLMLVVDGVGPIGATELACAWPLTSLENCYMASVHSPATLFNDDETAAHTKVFRIDDVKSERALKLELMRRVRESLGIQLLTLQGIAQVLDKQLKQRQRRMKQSARRK